MLWKHPAEVGETYWQHAKYAMGVSYKLLRGSAQALIHAALPDCPQNPEYELSGIAEWAIRESIKRTPPAKK